MKERVTKDEACQRLGVHLSTLDRMIKRNEVETEMEPQGSRHRVYVLLDQEEAQGAHQDTSPDAARYMSADPAHTSEVIVLRERVKSLEEMISYYQQQLKDAEWRYGQLQANLTTAQNTLAAVTTRALADPSTRTKRNWWPWRRSGDDQQHQPAMQG